nr:MAG TPA: hypothetical protein [Caudoviricetes sp.]
MEYCSSLRRSMSLMFRIARSFGVSGGFLESTIQYPPYL